MIGGVEKEKLTKESILKRVTEQQIYEFYWKPFKLGHIYSSPFRKDSMPSFGIYRTANNTLRHHDFGNEAMSGNCFSFVCNLRGITLWEALHLIEKDLCLGSGIYKPPAIFTVEKKQVEINITAKNFTQEELKYWNQYAQDITDLKKNDVYSVDKLWINGFPQNIKGELCFAYLLTEEGKEYLKIYRPFSQDKWKYNGPNKLISGWDRVKDGGERVIITGSKKDEMCIRKLTEDCCSTQSESKTSISPEKIEFFQNNWKRRIIGWDADPPGVEACTYYNKTHNFEYVNVPKSLYRDGVKDWADFVASYGLGQLQYYLKNKNVL